MSSVEAALDARGHAALASRLLRAVAAAEDELEGLDDDRRLQLAIGGGLRRFNDNQRWTVDLAKAHALTAIALHLSNPDAQGGHR